MFEKVRDIIVDTLSCELEDVTMEATLAEDLGADSLDAVELNIALEEQLGLSIADEDRPNMKTCLLYTSRPLWWVPSTPPPGRTPPPSCRLETRSKRARRCASWRP